MNYKQVEKGVFVKRINRFIALVEMQNQIERVHVPNTGRCRELLVPGVEVILSAAENPNRKTAYSLIAVYKGSRLINMDSQIPHQVVYEALAQGKLEEIGQLTILKKEVKYKNSRFDIYFETAERKAFMEVKGVTLEQDGVSMFPDAPTTGGTRHMEELIEACQEGYEGYIFFLIQMEGVECFTPNREMDKLFAQTLEKAAKAGVKVMAYDAKVSEGEIVLRKPIPIQLEKCM